MNLAAASSIASGKAVEPASDPRHWPRRGGSSRRAPRLWPLRRVYGRGRPGRPRFRYVPVETEDAGELALARQAQWRTARRQHCRPTSADPVGNQKGSR